MYIIPASPIAAHNGVPAPYTGSFPSQDLCNFYNSQKELLKYFDNGVRMVYGKPDLRVEVDNATPAHPIPNPPKGF